MNLKYVENISPDNAEGTMRLYGRIGNDIHGSYFAEEMRYLANMCKTINMRINSEGGSVLDGYTILDAMNEINASGKCVVNTHNSGMAASMASVILCNGINRTADNYSITMIHNASGETGDAVLNAINASIQIIYKDRTHLNGDVAAELMNKETFMTAKEAETYGFIDKGGIIETGKKLKLPKKKSIENLALIYNQLLTPKKMDKITASLNLAENSTEDVVVESIETLKKELETEKAEKEKLAARIAELDKLAEDAKKAEEAKTESEVIAKVEAAITKGLDKTKKDELIALGKINMSLLDTVIESSTKASKAVAVLPAGALNAKDADEKSSWTILDWMKKDPKGLTVIKNETPEVYSQMYDNFYVLGIGNKNFKKK